ncbi:DipZ protein [Pseudomonas synxantha]|nr:DipZ protein [Pseudomonas synxantha]
MLACCYLFDAQGQSRYSHFGEGRYDAQEQEIQALLQEAKAQAPAIE